MRRLRPAQGAVRLICGAAAWKGPAALEDRLRAGRSLLASLVGMDFGYDLQAWHDALKAGRQGGYPYGRNSALPRIMQAALQSPEWQEAARRLSASPQGD